MRIAGSFGSRRRGVARDHRAGAPPGEHHQVALGAALGEPCVGEVVAELVRVQPLDTGLGGASPDHLSDTRRRVIGPFSPIQSAGECGIGSSTAGAEVAVDRLRGLGAEARRAVAVALAGDADEPGRQVDVVDLQAGQLGQAQAGVEEQPDDRGVAPILEGVARARLEQALQILDRGTSTGCSATFGGRIRGIGDG